MPLSILNGDVGRTAKTVATKDKVPIKNAIQVYMRQCIILGAGITGLAAAYASGHPVYEARSNPGGICSSYYMVPGGAERLPQRPVDQKVYRFEIGGGHWIFGGDPAVTRFIDALTPLKAYRRHSAVYLPRRDQYVPYPLQNHLNHLDDTITARALTDMLSASAASASTMEGWLRGHFGDALCELFFAPFHERYTAGLWREIAPQDPYKSPMQVKDVVTGAFGEGDDVGYNVEFRYPKDGLDALMRALAARCTVHYDKRVVGIDPDARTVRFEDGTQAAYEVLLSTLPLNRMMNLCRLSAESRPDPHTSVLVLNVGAIKGDACPDQHWIYVADSESGFHRVGFYSNVDSSFLPNGDASNRVSIYVERAYHGDEQPPSEDAMAAYTDQVIEELKAWGYIESVEVVDPTWIDVAYTWAWPESDWRRQALRILDEQDILMVGRYGRWTFQGIADSLRDGLFVGNTVREKQ